MQVVGIYTVAGRTGATLHLLFKPDPLNMLERISQRRHLVRRHAGLLAGDAQALDGIRVGNLPSQRMNTRGVDEGTRAVFLQVNGVRKLLVGIVAESLPPVQR